MTQSRQNATSCYSDKLNLADQVELFSTVPTSAGGIGPLIEKRRIRNKLVSEMKLSPMSSITGANYDEGEESFRHGRSQTVDSETRGSSYTWCQDFLSGRPSMRIIFKSASFGKMEFADFRAGKYKASPDCGTE